MTKGKAETMKGSLRVSDAARPLAEMETLCREPFVEMVGENWIAG